MSLMTWTEDYRVNVGVIDEQHQKLFDLVNSLHDSLSGDRASIVKHLDETTQFVLDHFATEERFMEQNNYPDYAAHKEFHDKLVEQVAALQAKVQAGEAEVTEDVTAFVRDWLQHHIPVIDKQYGPFLNEKGIR